ncbi:diguanylate cyclase [Lysobacter sp. A3-1-A15]|uniref:diguanylate cyclase n=1 Tax=Novilysobacter viscosus TaxID=3098602 RepID=UPI002ED8F01D
MLIAIATGVPAQAHQQDGLRATPSAASSEAISFRLSRLDDDPVPARVLEGEFDDRFRPAVPATVLREQAPEPRWWRLTVDNAVAAAGDPHLVLSSPYLTVVETWRPGEPLPVRRALMGRGMDDLHAPRALVVPLPAGIAPGQSLYLRVDGRGASVPMRIAIEPLRAVHRADLLHVAWRAGVLVSLLVLAVLALGFWIGVREPTYAYLMAMLLAQAGYLVSMGGELRAWPAVAEVLGTDPRTVRLFALLAVIAANFFVGSYLELRSRQPRMQRVLDICSIAAAVLLTFTFATGARWIAVAGNALVLAVAGTVILATVNAIRQGFATARLLLLSWLPLVVLVALRVGELLGGWVNPPWMVHALPAAMAFSGLVVTIGLAGQLQQLRRDRDRASRMASYDALTGASSRPAIEEQLRNAVRDAHRLDRPLSVVFFDIDRFKHINDEHGHRAGDQCLRIIAARTRNRLRTYDQMGRYGGDELVVVLPDTELHEAFGVAENLRSAVNCRPLSMDGVMLQASLSIGVAQLQPGETAEQLLERADAALYASKAGGRDRVMGSTRVTDRHHALAPTEFPR